MLCFQANCSLHALQYLSVCFMRMKMKWIQKKPSSIWMNTSRSFKKCLGWHARVITAIISYMFPCSRAEFKFSFPIHSQSLTLFFPVPALSYCILWALLEQKKEVVMQKLKWFHYYAYEIFQGFRNFKDPSFSFCTHPWQNHRLM